MKCRALLLILALGLAGCGLSNETCTTSIVGYTTSEHCFKEGKYGEECEPSINPVYYTVCTTPTPGEKAKGT